QPDGNLFLLLFVHSAPFSAGLHGHRQLPPHYVAVFIYHQ
ncbi:hypothetical protein LCGC14_3019420, partial [marine sediment metagenome]